MDKIIVEAVEERYKLTPVEALPNGRFLARDKEGKLRTLDSKSVQEAVRVYNYQKEHKPLTLDDFAGGSEFIREGFKSEFTREVEKVKARSGLSRKYDLLKASMLPSEIEALEARHGKRFDEINLKAIEEFVGGEA